MQEGGAGKIAGPPVPARVSAVARPAEPDSPASTNVPRGDSPQYRVIVRAWPCASKTTSPSVRRAISIWKNRDPKTWANARSAGVPPKTINEYVDPLVKLDDNEQLVGVAGRGEQ